MKTPISRRAGFTLLEMTVSIAVLGLVMWITGMVTSSSRDAFDVSSRDQRAEALARRSLDRVVTELIPASATTMTGLGTDTISFNQSAGVVDAGPNVGDVILGPQMQLVTELEPGEADNGVDDDGDRTADERRVVLVRNAGLGDERRVVLCTGVRELLEGEAANFADDNGNGLADEAGFVATLAGDVLVLRLSIEVGNGEADPVVATVETSTRLRVQ